MTKSQLEKTHYLKKKKEEKKSFNHEKRKKEEDKNKWADNIFRTNEIYLFI